MSKKIIILADGTGNAFSNQESNVFRILSALDNSAKNQISFYIRGVGTSGVKLLAKLDGATGFGVPSNVRKLYLFLCQNYRPGDQVYMFGFSRGAFTIRTLIGFISSQGLIPRERLDGDFLAIKRLVERTYQGYRRKSVESWDSYQVPLLFKMKGALQKFKKKVFGVSKNESNLEVSCEWPDNKLESIEFVGLFDTVEAFGVPIEELRLAIDKLIYPISFRNHSMPRLARVVRHALSLDDERQTFHPIQIKEPNLDEDDVICDRIKEVWFAGAHSDVGGGYPDGSVSYVPLVWMLDELFKCTDGLAFRPGTVESFRDAASAYGELHDSRQGLKLTYRYSPRTLDKSPPPLIHYSVIERMMLGADNYAPVPLAPCACATVVYPDGSEANILSSTIANPTVHQSRSDLQYLRKLSAPRQHYIELMLDLIWWRRVTYFGLVVSMLLLALGPLMATQLEEGLVNLKRVIPSISVAQASIVSLSDIGSFLAAWGASIEEIMGVVLRLMKFPFQWLESISPIAIGAIFHNIYSHIIYYCITAVAAAYFAIKSGYLKSRIGVFARTAWISEEVSIRRSVDNSRPLELARSLENSWTKLARKMRTVEKWAKVHRYGVGLLSLFWSAIVIFVAMTIFWVIVTGVNRFFFEAYASIGRICNGTPPDKWQWASALHPKQEARTQFETSSICWPSGLAVEEGGTYRLTVEMAEPWFERNNLVDINGYRNDVALAAIYRISGLRWPSSAWYQPIARIGREGEVEWPLVPIDGSQPLPERPGICRPDLIASSASGLEDATEFTRHHTGVWKSSDGQEVACESLFPRTVLESQFTARKTGELFLFVNDLIPFPFFRIDDAAKYYGNNRGRAKVTLEAMSVSQIQTTNP